MTKALNSFEFKAFVMHILVITVKLKRQLVYDRRDQWNTFQQILLYY